MHTNTSTHSLCQAGPEAGPVLSDLGNIYFPVFYLCCYLYKLSKPRKN